MPGKGSTYPLVIRSPKELFSRLRILMFRSTRAKEYLKSIQELALQKGFSFHTDKPLRMDIVVCPRDRRETDAHNYAKAALDIFQEVGMYEDDVQIVDLRIRLGPVIKGGRMVVSLWEIEPDRQLILNEAWR